MDPGPIEEAFNEIEHLRKTSDAVDIRIICMMAGNRERRRDILAVARRSREFIDAVIGAAAEDLSTADENIEQIYCTVCH